MRSKSFFMRRLLPLLPLAAVVAACSPTDPQPDGSPPQPKAASVTAAHAELGSKQWFAWVDDTLLIDDEGQGPNPGSDAWNRAVQRALGEEAPQLPLGSPAWQQAVDALLRTRAGSEPS